MKTHFQIGRETRRSRREGAQVGMIVALVLAALVAAGVVSLLLSRRASVVAEPPAPIHAPESTTAPPGASRLSAATLALLRGLALPVEIRFYSVWANNGSDEGNRLFAEQVSRLLALYEAEGAGKVTVKRFDSRSAAGAREAALADGLDPLRRDLGESSFLGVAVMAGGQRAVLSRLSRDWADAVEYDLSRAIARVSGKPGSTAVASVEPVVNPSPENAAAAEALLLEMPEIATLSKEEAERRVREAALEEFRAAAAGMQAELAEAQERLASARAISPEAEETAQQALRALRTAQNEKLGEMSRRMQARLAAVERLKAGDKGIPNNN